MLQGRIARKETRETMQAARAIMRGRGHARSIQSASVEGEDARGIAAGGRRAHLGEPGHHVEHAQLALHLDAARSVLIGLSHYGTHIAQAGQPKGRRALDGPVPGHRGRAVGKAGGRSVGRAVHGVEHGGIGAAVNTHSQAIGRQIALLYQAVSPPGVLVGIPRRIAHATAQVLAVPRVSMIALDS